MNLTSMEEKLLRKIAKSELITKNELKDFLQVNGGLSNINVVVDSATKGLMEKDLISTIAPLGSTCFIITQRGNRFLNELG